MFFEIAYHIGHTDLPFSRWLRENGFDLLSTCLWDLPHPGVAGVSLPSQLTLFIFKTRYNFSHFNQIYKDVLLLFMCICVGLCGCLNARGGSQRPEEGTRFHATVTGDVSCLAWVLWFQPQTFGRAGSALDHWASSLIPGLFILKYLILWYSLCLQCCAIITTVSKSILITTKQTLY